MGTKPIMIWGFILAMVLAGGYATPVCAEESKVFTEEDLEEYQGSNGYKPEDSSQIPERQISTGNKQSDPNTEAKAWCDRVTRAKDRVERAKQAVSSAPPEERTERVVTGTKRTTYSDYYGSVTVERPRYKTVTTKNHSAEAAREKLKAAEAELKSIEDEADRRGIPPGWLYCNY